MLAAQGGFTEAELKASALANLGWWHHSLENTIDKLDWTYMAEHLRVYAAYLWELCTAIVLPFEFVGVADQFIERLEQFREPGAAIALDGAMDRARAFRAAAERLEQQTAVWRARYDSDPATDTAAADMLNDGFKRLSRLLVPLASTAKGTYGHDPYGYTPQGTMIPSLYDMPALGRLPQDSEQRWMLETQLVRARNHVADALDDACTVIDSTLRRLG